MGERDVGHATRRQLPDLAVDRIDVRFDIDADASPADIEAIVAQSQKRSAVFDIITNPTTVQVTVV